MVDYTSASVPPNNYPALVPTAGSNVVSVMSSDPGAGQVNIAAGQSLSGAIDLVNQRLHRLVLPAGWTAADITFQSSTDGTTYSDVFDMTDGEVKIPTAIAAAGRTIIVNQAVFFGIRYLKVRSGTAAAVVNQAANRDILLRTVTR